MALFMESTEVPDTKTVAEIQDLLARRGASSVMVEYENGQVESLMFQFTVNEQSIPFRLPCRHESVTNILTRHGKKVRKNDTMDRMSRRIAWRQILRWVQAQLALIETGMVNAQEVFLPYAIVRTDGVECSMHEMIEKRGYLALPRGAEKEASE